MMSVGGVMSARWVQAPVEVTASSPLDLAPRLPSKLREMCPFTASRAFQWATLAVAPLFFQTGSFELALMAGKLRAHVSICQPDEPLLTAICRVLLWRKASQSWMRLVCCSWTERTPSEFARTECDPWINPARLLNLWQQLLLLLQNLKCICLLLRNPSRKLIFHKGTADCFTCPPSLIHFEPFVTHTSALKGVGHSTERNSLLRAESAGTDLWLYLY